MKTLNKNIEMICKTYLDGTIEPKRIKILCKDGSKQVYNILKIHKVEELKLAGVKTRNYECDIRIDGVVKIGILKYDLDSCRWALFKI